ncbi:MAG: MFS transporter, partial [Acidimicrobiia bacterium]|nr:MFS transporter [Acidimicrobiia bacterium]
VGSLALGLAGSALPVYLAIFLLGLASATTNGTGMTYYSNVGGPGFRGTAMAVFSASLLGGQAIGPAVGGLIATVGDWRLAMYVAAGVASVLMVGMTLGTRANRSKTVTSTVDPPVPGSGGEIPWWVTALVHSVPFVVFMTLGSVPQTLVPIVGSDQLGLSAAGIGLGLGAGGLARFIGTIIGGRLSDLVSRKAVLVPGLLGQAIGVGILAFPLTLVSWVAAIVLMSLASYAVSVAATVVGDLADPSRVGTHLGRFRFWGDIGLVVGPITISAIYERAGSSAAFLVVAGLLTAVGLACLKLLPETGR